MPRIFTTAVADVYPHYVTKVTKKGRTQNELDEVIRWLTGYDQPALERHLAEGTTFEDFFDRAQLNRPPSSSPDRCAGSRCRRSRTR